MPRAITVPKRALIRRESLILLKQSKNTSFLFHSRLGRCARAVEHANGAGITHDIIFKLIVAKISRLLPRLHFLAQTNIVESQGTSSVSSKRIEKNQICLVCRSLRHTNKRKVTRKNNRGIREAIKIIL